MPKKSLTYEDLRNKFERIELPPVSCVLKKYPMKTSYWNYCRGREYIDVYVRQEDVERISLRQQEAVPFFREQDITGSNPNPKVMLKINFDEDISDLIIEQIRRRK